MGAAAVKPIVGRFFNNQNPAVKAAYENAIQRLNEFKTKYQKQRAQKSLVFN